MRLLPLTPPSIIHYSDTALFIVTAAVKATKGRQTKKLVWGQVIQGISSCSACARHFGIWKGGVSTCEADEANGAGRGGAIVNGGGGGKGEPCAPLIGPQTRNGGYT